MLRSRKDQARKVAKIIFNEIFSKSVFLEMKHISHFFLISFSDWKLSIYIKYSRILKKKRKKQVENKK